jgi:hypothetical protein
MVKGERSALLGSLSRDHHRQPADRGNAPEPAMSYAPRCSWCDRTFRPRQGGRAQRFCRPACRRAFHTAVRAWALGAIENGALTVTDIKDHLQQRARCLEARSHPSRHLRDLRRSRRRRRDRIASPTISACCSMRWMRSWGNRQSRCWSGYVGSRAIGRGIASRSCMPSVAFSRTCSTWRATHGLELARRTGHHDNVGADAVVEPVEFLSYVKSCQAKRLARRKPLSQHRYGYQDV